MLLSSRAARRVNRLGKAGGMTVRSGLGGGGAFIFRPPASGCFALDAVDEIEGGPRLVTVKSNRSPVLVTTSLSVVGVGEGDRDGGVTPSKHSSRTLRVGR